MSGAKQAVVTDLDEPIREQVLEEAADELCGADRTTLNLISGGLFIRESDVPIFQLAQAVVADSDAKDVRSEILEGLCAGAYRFGMHHPVFLPDTGLHLSKQRGLFQFIAKLGAEDSGERFHWNQKVFACRAPAASSSKAAARGDVMNMRMIEELAGPGVEHADHPEAGADEARVVCQLQQGL